MMGDPSANADNSPDRGHLTNLDGTKEYQGRELSEHRCATPLVLALRRPTADAEPDYSITVDDRRD